MLYWTLLGNKEFRKKTSTVKLKFRLEKRACHCDPLSAFSFALALEILFLLLKAITDVKGLDVFDHCRLYSSYVNDMKFFVKVAKSIKNIVSLLSAFSFPLKRKYWCKKLWDFCTFGHCYHCSLHADDTNIFVKDTMSIESILSSFYFHFYFYFF